MMKLLFPFSLLLDIAPGSWAMLFISPVLVIALVILAVAVLVQSIRERKREKNSARLEKATPEENRSVSAEATEASQDK